ncbi:hypothetical protein CL614_01845 [archaeon]|nr:hypothetical protein [archaeon]|tara:strand:+ start:4494 stop:4682 length:189 start_codon:yes stop_codon:yes gene_type:complete
MTDARRQTIFNYLDKLRESGKTNMFGAVPYIQVVFGMDESDSKDILIEWMNTFAERHNLHEH